MRQKASRIRQIKGNNNNYFVAAPRTAPQAASTTSCSAVTNELEVTLNLDHKYYYHPTIFRDQCHFIYAVLSVDAIDATYCLVLQVFFLLLARNFAIYEIYASDGNGVPRQSSF